MMLQRTMAIRFGRVMAGLALVSTPVCRAQSLVSASIDPSTVVRYRVSLAGSEGAWAVVPSAVSIQAGISGGPAPTMTIRAIHVAPPFVSCAVGVGSGTVAVGLTALVLDAAPTAVSIPTTIGPTGLAEFAAAGISTAATGTANYEAIGLSCQALAGAGAPCAGPFNLSLVPEGPTGVVSTGSIAASGVTRPFSLVFVGSRSLVTGAAWGRVDVRAEIAGSISTGQASCPADFDQSGDLSVQDIFAFLNGWFAGDPGADFDGQGGLSVQDIFEFLNAWFAGCP
ncbi:MAG TPA: GC-type dockerin domain-anchored protein [Phycisphaerales bacterium]|nr:GC-type dockerin domain-anchored protein [Phycisphaerales bacterium]